jgi:hypothetical protein
MGRLPEPLLIGNIHDDLQEDNTEGNIILEDLLREPSDLRLFDEK